LKFGGRPPRGRITLRGELIAVRAESEHRVGVSPLGRLQPPMPDFVGSSSLLLQPGDARHGSDRTERYDHACQLAYDQEVEHSILPPVVLRPLAVADATVIAEWAADPDFVREADWSRRSSAGEYEHHHRKLIEQPPRGFIRLGVCSGNDLVGYVDFHGENPNCRELGFLIGARGRWGRGFGLSAAIAALRYGFDELGLDEITAEAFDSNQRSIRILRRLGFHETGRNDDVQLRGTPATLVRFTILAPQWRRGLS